MKFKIHFCCLKILFVVAGAATVVWLSLNDDAPHLPMNFNTYCFTYTMARMTDPFIPMVGFWLLFSFAFSSLLGQPFHSCVCPKILKLLQLMTIRAFNSFSQSSLILKWMKCYWEVLNELNFLLEFTGRNILKSYAFVIGIS